MLIVWFHTIDEKLIDKCLHYFCKRCELHEIPTISTCLRPPLAMLSVRSAMITLNSGMWWGYKHLYAITRTSFCPNKHSFLIFNFFTCFLVYHLNLWEAALQLRPDLHLILVANCITLQSQRKQQRWSIFTNMTAKETWDVRTTYEIAVEFMCWRAALKIHTPIT